MSCKYCNGRGFIIKKDDQGYTSAKDCICRRQDKWVKYLESKNILNRFRENNFNNYIVDSDEKKRAKNVCMRFAEDYKGKSLMITGQVGGGKTHLALATVREIAENNIKRDVSYSFPEIVNYTQMMIRLKNAERFDSEETLEDVLDRYKRCSLLVIDDLYKATQSDKERSYVYQIVESRYNNNKSMIITTEFTFDELLKIDQSVASRLYEMTDGKYRVGITEDNYRLRK